MRILVTGGGGFIGSRVCALAGEDVVPVAVVRPGHDPPAGLPARAELVEADLLSPDLGPLPDRLDAVVHLAQSRDSGDEDADRREMLKLSVEATSRLLEHARAAGASRFLLASTATIYARSDEPLAEDAPLDLPSDYARAKAAAERTLEQGGGELSAIALRIFTPYGPGQRDRLIARLIERVRAGEPVQVEGERGLLLSPIHVDDIALAIHGALALPAEPGFEALNVAADEALGIREIAELIGEAVGRPPEFERLGGAEPGGLTADCTKLRAALPMLTPRPFAAGIRETAGAA